MISEGHFFYKGVKVSQVETIKDYFKTLLCKFDTVIELGTYHGGLSLIISDILEDCDGHLVTVDYEVYNQEAIRKITDCGHIFLKLDLDKDLGNVLEYIKGKTIVLCDANKAVEFNKIAPHLNSGDYIGVHDYAEDDLAWEEINRTTWRYWLCKMSDLNLDGLKKSDEYNEFTKAVWGLFVKI